MPRLRSSESWMETRRAVVAALAEGRITGREVMAELGISSGTLGGWVRAEGLRREREQHEGTSAFVPVRLSPGAMERSAVVLTLAGGRRLRIPPGFPCAEVAALVRALESSC